jgi:hypothetical protein
MDASLSTDTVVVGLEDGRGSCWLEAEASDVQNLNLKPVEIPRFAKLGRYSTFGRGAWTDISPRAE